MKENTIPFWGHVVGILILWLLCSSFSVGFAFVFYEAGADFWKSLVISLLIVNLSMCVSLWKEQAKK